MKLKAVEINLTPRQKEILERLSNSTHSELHFTHYGSVLAETRKRGCTYDALDY